MAGIKNVAKWLAGSVLVYISGDRFLPNMKLSKNTANTINFH